MSKTISQIRDEVALLKADIMGACVPGRSAQCAVERDVGEAAKISRMSSGVLQLPLLSLNHLLLHLRHHGEGCGRGHGPQVAGDHRRRGSHLVREHLE